MDSDTYGPQASRDSQEREFLQTMGLLENPNQCMAAAAWSGEPGDPTRLELELQQLTVKLARTLERTEQSYQNAVAEGYELRGKITQLAEAIRYLAGQHQLTEPQREMVQWVLHGPPDQAQRET